jgi:peptidoglycan/xylan/chitin deacetylase (PgdA/CDA1 family)
MRRAYPKTGLHWRAMPEPPKKRPSRRARERSLRRRRAAALLVLAAIVGLVVALTVAFSSGSGNGHKNTATSTPSTTPSHKRAEHRATEVRAKLDRLSNHAVVHYAEIGRPVYCGGTKKKMVALTFDDGPGPYTVGSILHVLRKRHARATFFLVGRRIQEYPTVPKQEAELGAVGDHTWNHASLTGLDENAMKSEVEDAQTAIAQSTQRPVTLFRPPYGARDAVVDHEISSLGMVEVMWSLDSLDWQGGNWKAVVRRVTQEVRPGSIVLMHDIHPNTIAAMWKLVPALHHLGYRLVTVPELLALDPPTDRQLQRGMDGCEGNATSPNAG